MSKEDISIININYKKFYTFEDNINIFGSEFVKNNKNNCKMIIDNKEYDLEEKFNIKNCNNNILNIKLKGIDNITNMSYMFKWCSSLSSLPDISKWNTDNVTNMSYMFYGCESLISLPDISKWNTSNVNDMSYMFRECKSLISLPDISKWNIYKVTMSHDMFSGCTSLISLPNISKWNTSNNNIENMFNDCLNSLINSSIIFK